MNRMLIVALIGLTLCGQTLPPGVQAKASMGGITEYDFPNGLKVLLYPDAASPKVTVNVTYLVGSRHEGYGETGMAHLLEHMDFIETTNGRQIKNEIVARGAQWNGTTSYDRTNYYETVPATDENLKWALGLEADRMTKVKFTKQILDTEMTVVRNEFERGENSPDRVLRERVEATAFLWHNYGKSTIGSKEDIEKVPVDRLAAFYHKYYQPDNAVLVITGRLDDGEDARVCRRHVREVREALDSAGGDVHGRAPAGWRALRRTAARRPRAGGHRGVSRSRGGASRFGGAAGSLRHHERRRWRRWPQRSRRRWRWRRTAREGSGRRQDRGIGQHAVGAAARSRPGVPDRDSQQRSVAWMRRRRPWKTRSRKSRATRPSKEEVERVRSGLLRTLEEASAIRNRSPPAR